MVDEGIHRDSLSAWRALASVGGLEPSGRDSDFVSDLKSQLDRDAQTIESALRGTPVNAFVQALFRVIQPFPMMCSDVLRFFEKAGAREGQSQWRVVLEEEMDALRHFQEFLERWETVSWDFDVPAIDGGAAFLPTSVERDVGWDDATVRHSANSGHRGTSGIVDVDLWLELYDEGAYGPLPASLRPDGLPAGLDDAAGVVLVALDVIRQRWSSRAEFLAETGARRTPPDWRNGFDPGTIAQNETDYWLRNTVLTVARAVNAPIETQKRFGAALQAFYEPFGRRPVNADIELADLETLLSLPAWRKRHELFAVWVATEILGSIAVHDVAIHHAQGELRFGFGESKIADVRSARPQLALYAERKTKLDAPVGKGRKQAVQPDFGLWRDGREPDRCQMVVEVKHYKRRDRRNFRDALVDYARAHPSAEVLLVNYGPVGSFEEIRGGLGRRCEAIGYLNPQEHRVRSAFRDRVRFCVGEPARSVEDWLDDAPEMTVAIDVSASMDDILRSACVVSRVVSARDSRFISDGPVRDFPH